MMESFDDISYPQNETKARPSCFKFSTKSKIIKNLICLSFAQFLVFTAFDSLSNLQSTLNSEEGVGLASQATIYACFTVSSLFLPTYIIRKIGCKNTLMVCVFSICPYVLANAHVHWASLIPTAFLCGIAFGPFWAAKCTYVNDISHQYSVEVRGTIDVINAWFFGISSFFHENAEIWGNVISYEVLKTTENFEMPVNGTNATVHACGALFCGDKSDNLINPNLIPPSNGKRNTLIHIYLGLVVIAGIIIKFLVDPLQEKVLQGHKYAHISCDLFVATFKHMKNKNQLFLIPLSFYCGIADGFYNSDFTKSYIACSWGISQVGFVTTSYGVSCAVMDCTSGILIKHLTRVPVFIFGAVCHAAMLITLLLWKPSPENPVVFFILAAIYGLGSSIWWSQIAAFYGVIFKKNEEAAFSNFYFWSSLGLLVAYAYGSTVCTLVKIYVLLFILMTGLAFYLVVEMRICTQQIVQDSSEERMELDNFQYERFTKSQNQSSECL